MAVDPKVKELIEKAAKEEKEVLGEFKIDDFLTPDIIEEVYVKGAGTVKFKRVTTEDFWRIPRTWKSDGEYTTILMAIMLSKADSTVTFEEMFEKLKRANPVVTSAIYNALSDKMVFLKTPKNSGDGSTVALKRKTSG